MHSTYMTWTAFTDTKVNDTEPIQIPANKAFTTGLSARGARLELSPSRLRQSRP